MLKKMVKNVLERIVEKVEKVENNKIIKLFSKSILHNLYRKLIL
jgi:hypothetical protein